MTPCIVFELVGKIISKTILCVPKNACCSVPCQPLSHTSLCERDVHHPCHGYGHGSLASSIQQRHRQRLVSSIAAAEYSPSQRPAFSIHRLASVSAIATASATFVCSWKDLLSYAQSTANSSAFSASSSTGLHLVPSHVLHDRIVV